MLTTVSVSVAAIAEALELDELPEGLKGSDDIDLEVEVDDDELKEEFESEPETLADLFRQSDVMDLAAAIRRGDAAEAELMLDRLCADDDTVTGWVQLGRYSRKARHQARALRAAA